MTSERSGFSLVEMLVAIAILAVVSASVAGIFAAVARISRDASLEQRATISAKAYFEDVNRHVREGGAVTLAALPEAPNGCTGPTVAALAGGAAMTVSIVCPPLDSLALSLANTP